MRGLKKRIIWGYGAANFGYGFVSQMFASYFVFFATTILKMSGSVVGLIVSLSIVWDGMSDPIMGFISDNTKSRYGKRHVYIFLGSILIAFFNMTLWFVSPHMNQVGTFVWVLANVFLIKTSLTVFVTPYAALGAELTDDYDERSKVQIVKTVYFLAALMVVTAISMFVFFKPTPDYPLGQMNPTAYRYMAITSSLVMLITGLYTCVSTKRYKADIYNQAPNYLKNMVKTFADSMKNTEFKIIFLGYLFTNIASAIIGVIGLHTFTYTFEMTSDKIGNVLAVQFLVCILAQPIWFKISKVMDKKWSVILGLFISVIACFLLTFFVLQRHLVIQNYQWMMVYGLIIGFGTSGLFALPLSMIADTVDLQEAQTGLRNEGVYYGVLNLGFKLSQSLAILLLGLVLDLIQFNPDRQFQTEQTARYLGLLLAIGSLISFVLAIRAYMYYSLNKRLVGNIQKKLKGRYEKTSN